MTKTPQDKDETKFIDSRTPEERKQDAEVKSETTVSNPPPPATEGVVLAEEGTPLARFQKDRTDAISAMFDRDKMCGRMHTTSKFFADIDNSVREILVQERQKSVERIAALKIAIQLLSELGEEKGQNEASQ